jgi:hypothetical protein
MLPDDAIVAGFGTAGTGAEITSVFAAGSGCDAGCGGTESAVFTSLVALPLAVVGAEGTLAVTAAAGFVVSIAGGFAEATDAAGGGQRWPWYWI